MTHEQLSTEEHLNGYLTKDQQIQQLLGLDPFLSDLGSTSPPDNCYIPPDEINSIDPQNCDLGKDDLDIYLPKHGNSKDQTTDASDYHLIDKKLWKTFSDVSPRSKSLSLKSDHVLLSSSVDVPMLRKLQSLSRSIEIVNDLEMDHKPRYKSDHFSQHGKIRLPRYVTDQLGNHYVSIKVKADLQGHIRVDWITIPNEQNTVFSMPYKFQVDHYSPDVPDENPFYDPIAVDASGIMKMYLVLIKSKLDELRQIQPLQLFPPVPETSNQNPLLQMPLLSPKKLIQKYQLEKSRLAFTYCPLGPDGKTYIPDWTTTVTSSMLTERVTESPKKRKVTCPQCLHTFQITIDETNEVHHENVLKKHKQ